MHKLKEQLQKLADPARAKVSRRFFKTGKGEYGEGDIFIGLTVPQARTLAREFSGLSLREVQKLLSSKIHEERLVALLILVHNFARGSEAAKKTIYEFYLKSTRFINNWDLVDLSAPKIVGEYLLDKDKRVLSRLARSKNIWERRIAIVSTYSFIRNDRFSEMLRIAELLLRDEHDLIHKAVGWMLREVGKRDFAAERRFLEKHYRKMPRTMLRYAIEKFSPNLQGHFLGRS